jgi:hypothetical protein
MRRQIGKSSVNKPREKEMKSAEKNDPESNIDDQSGKPV